MLFRDLNIGDIFITKYSIHIREVILYIKISNEGYIQDKHNALAVFNKEWPKGFMDLEDEVIKCV